MLHDSWLHEPELGLSLVLSLYRSLAPLLSFSAVSTVDNGHTGSFILTQKKPHPLSVLFTWLRCDILHYCVVLLRQFNYHHQLYLLTMANVVDKRWLCAKKEKEILISHS